MDTKKIDKYELKEEVGRGGMAVVYRAEDTSLGRVVALKLLHPYLTEDVQARKRLQSEARAVASLKHPLIPDVYDYSGKKSKHAYIVTEFIEGITLAKFLDEKKLHLAESALLLLHQVTTALHHAHGAGIIHRDLKPENIMITSSGEIKLMDFGISRIVENPGITSTGQILGSPAFMAPEIIKGQPTGKASDIFSLGILLYQMSTWELPFKGSNPHAVLIKIAETDYPDPELVRPEIGAPVARLIRKCLVNNPEERLGSTGEMLEAIEELLLMAGIKAKKIPSLTKKLILAQEKTEDELFPLVVDSFLKRAREEVDTPLGQQMVARLLQLVPDNEEVQVLFEELQAREKRLPLKYKIAGVAAIVSILLGVGFFFALSWRGGHKEGHGGTMARKAKGTMSTPRAVMEVVPDATEVGESPMSYVSDATAVSMRLPSMDHTMMGPAMMHTMDAMGVAKNMVPMVKLRPIMPFPIMIKPMTIGEQRVFTLFPFPQGQVTIELDGKELGQWGPRPPAISSISVGPGKHKVVFKHPLCYTSTVTIHPYMKSSKIARRLKWRPARILVTAPAGSAIAVRLLEGDMRTLSGVPGAPLEVSFPRVWNVPTVKAKVIVVGKDEKTREKAVTLRAGKQISVSFY